MRFLARLFSKEKPTKTPVKRDLAPPQPMQPVCVVGDVHGRIDLLDNLLAQLKSQHPSYKVILVGDLVDRGDESAAVLQRVYDLTQSAEPVICLMGNHEKMMLDFLDDPTGKGLRWLRYGGLQTLASYHVGGITEKPTFDVATQACAQLREALPKGMEAWLRALPLSWESGTVTVVHAAADPTLSMAEQEKSTLLWGHKDFFTHQRLDDLWIAHGHTVMDAPEYADSRISVDTGAYYTGKLTAALVSCDGDVQFVQAGRNAA